MKKIAIIDYGVGNLFSLNKAFEKYTKSVKVTEEIEDIENSDAIVLPGDGSFKAGIEGLNKRNLTTTITNFARSGKPVLGICLGAQLLFSSGYEFGYCKGLNLVNGDVKLFPKLKKEAKIPHIGWDKIYAGPKHNWESGILKNIPQNSDMYFVHSYILLPKNKKDVLANSTYYGFEYCVAVKLHNIHGLQFHPEKSGTHGLAIIKNFVSSV